MTKPLPPWLLKAKEAIRLNTLKRNRARDRHFDRVLQPHINRARKAGVVFYKDLTVYFNNLGVKNWKGQEWTKDRVSEIFRRQRRRMAEEAP